MNPNWAFLMFSNCRRGSFLANEQRKVGNPICWAICFEEMSSDTLHMFDYLTYEFSPRNSICLGSR